MQNAQVDQANLVHQAGSIINLLNGFTKLKLGDQLVKWHTTVYYLLTGRFRVVSKGKCGKSECYRINEQVAKKRYMHM